MPLDIVCFYADLGRPYLPLIEQMTVSAKRAMREARTVLLTPTPSDDLTALFDKSFDLSPHMDAKTTAETVCFDRARSTVSWQRQTKNRTVYVDPDIEFNRAIEFDGNFDVGLLWRPRKPDQPINTGIVLAEPGCPEFWTRYGAIVANLPIALRAWWCDQLAFSMMMGTMNLEQPKTLQAHDARVRLFKMTDHCTPREKATTDNPWAWHDKGARKWAVISNEVAA